MKKLPSKSIDLVLSDPPYNASNSNLKIWDYKLINEKWDKKFDPYPFLDEAFRVIKDWGSILTFCSYHLLWKYLEYGKKVQQVIHWEHITCVPSLTKTYHPCIEYIVWYSTPKYTFNKPAWRNVIREKKAYQYWEKYYIDDDKEKWAHPSIKPTPLLEKLIMVHSNEWDIILDPYVWSWSTCVAATKLNRNFIWCDMDRDYCNIAVRRINEIWQKWNQNKECELIMVDSNDESHQITEEG